MRQLATKLALSIVLKVIATKMLSICLASFQLVFILTLGICKAAKMKLRDSFNFILKKLKEFKGQMISLRKLLAQTSTPMEKQFQYRQEK